MNCEASSYQTCTPISMFGKLESQRSDCGAIAADEIVLVKGSQVVARKYFRAFFWPEAPW
jgi:hypothetical protein